MKLALLLPFTTSLTTSLTAAERPAKPNIILILTDDLGWQDVGCYDIDEPTPMETPHIDALAKKGVQFWHGYSPAPTCAPTRCAIMSGDHPARAQKTHVVGGHPPLVYHPGHPMMPPWYTGRMPEDTVTLPKLLQKNGYVTGHCGKWHMALDHHSFPQPKDQGFDWTRSNLGTTKKMTPNRITGFATDKEDDPYRVNKDGITTHQNSLDALQFVEEQKDKPFFLYYATWLVHTPIHTRSKALLDKYCKKLGVNPDPDKPGAWTGKGQTNPFYCAMVEELDTYMGHLFTYLESTDDPRWPGHKLVENTYIIFTSDNGGMEKTPGEIITDNYPLDRGKISIMEGGTRVPLIITGPGIEAGVQSDVLINGLDFYPTILTLTGTEKPEDKSLDGLDLSELLLKDSADPSLVTEADGKARDTMVWHFPNSVALESSIRVGGFKLVRNYNHVNDARTEPFELYQLYGKDGKRVDIEEAKNLAASMPDKVKEMDDKLTEVLTEMKASYPYYNPNHPKGLPNQDKVCKVLSHKQSGDSVSFKYRGNGAKVVRANLLYTMNGGDKSEEWFRNPAELTSEGVVTATLPAGTTHYLINLIDENNFLRSYPEVTRIKDGKDYSKQALASQP
ncbi:MAG: sulfatase [Akkermansiaceae bacterium]|nr:sulfatase [Akkermansiaceae bacterium]